MFSSSLLPFLMLLLASPFPEPGDTSGTRGNKSTKRLTRADQWFTNISHLQCFVCSIIQKAIPLKAESFLLDLATQQLSGYLVLWRIMLRTRDSTSEIRYSIQVDLNILVWIRQLKFFWQQDTCFHVLLRFKNFTLKFYFNRHWGRGLLFWPHKQQSSCKEESCLYQNAHPKTWHKGIPEAMISGLDNLAPALFF